MAKIGIDNYRFGQKNHWRRTTWNEIARRVKDRANARILYLAGEQDLDRAVAASKGFDPRNMIAVEMDAERTKKLRAAGVTTINANLLDVLYNWPEKHRVDVVVADFCFGFEASAVDLYDSLANPALVDACVLINLQRGRDASTNPIRAAFGGSRVYFMRDGEVSGEVDAKHRAMQYLMLHALDTVGVANGGEGPGIDLSLAKDERAMAGASVVLNAMQPRFLSYRSGRVLMDSAIFSHALHRSPSAFRRMLSAAGAWMTRYKADSPTVKRVVTAALAVQTARKAA